MSDLFTRLVVSVRENAELTILILVLYGAVIVYGNDRFATQDDLARAIKPVEDSILELRRGNLQQQRRELRSQIAEINYAIKNGEASNWQRDFLPELHSDLDDVQDQLKILGNASH